MEKGLWFILYVIFDFVAACALTLFRSRSHRFITFVISFWILGGSIINQDMFTLPLAQFSGGLQVGRILFLLLLMYGILLRGFGQPERMAVPRLPYEKYLYLFLVLFFVVLGYHLSSGSLPTREFVRLSDGTLRVLVIYLLLKRYSNSETLEVIFLSAMIVAVATSLVGFVQFFFEPTFLRVGDNRVAFGSHLRANGVFSSEYLNSYFLIAALALLLVYVRSAHVKTALAILFGSGILLSFHRMSWMVAAVVLCAYLVLQKRQQIWKLAGVAAIAVFLGYGIFTEVFPMQRVVQTSTMYRERISSNTIDSRLKFFSIVIDNFDKVALWGAGTRTSSLYYHGMMSTGIVGREWALGRSGSIHNLYLELLFLYGLSVLLAFCLMLLAMIRYHFARFKTGSTAFLFPVLFLVMFSLMNLTNSIPLDSQFGILFAIALGASAATGFGRIHWKVLA